MAEYKLKFLDPDFIPPEEEAERQKTLDELSAFIDTMRGRPLAGVTLDETQSAQWDQKGEVDYQDHYGREIVRQVDDGETEALVIHNVQGLPLAMAFKSDGAGWQGIGVDERLREIVAGMLEEKLG